MNRSKHKAADTRPAVELPLFSSRPLQNRHRRGFILNAGSSIWGLDWCPTAQNNDRNYLAVAGFRGKSEEHHALGELGQSNEKGCIQIWDLGTDVVDKVPSGKSPTATDLPILDLCLLHDFGCIWHLKWCPFGARDMALVPEAEHEGLPKIGILALACGDGTVKLLAVPCPVTMRAKIGRATNGRKPLYVRTLRPLMTVRALNSAPLTLAWGGPTTLAAGLTNGEIVVVDVMSFMTESRDGVDVDGNDFVVHQFPAHDSGIRAVDWSSHNNPTQLASVGMDGRVLCFDVRDPYMPIQVHRTRGFLFGVSWPTHFPGVIFTDADNAVRQLRVENPIRTHGFMAFQTQIWDLNASAFHPFVAGASADGRVAIANIHRIRARHQKYIQRTICRLCWDENLQTYSIIDDEDTEEVAIVYHSPENLYNQMFPAQVQIQRTAWSNDLLSASWIAGGGSDGLICLEATFE